MPSPRGLTNIIAAIFGGIALLAGLVGFTSIPSSAVHYSARQSATVADAATTSSSTARVASQNTSSASSSEATSTPVAATTVIYKYVTEPASPSSPDLTVTSGGVSEIELTQKLQELENKLESQISSITSGGSTMASGGVINMIAASNKIDELNGTTLSNVTVNGVSGLTAADMPDLSSKYLSVSGNSSVAGLTKFSNASTSELSVFNHAWFGATATSTFTSAGWLGIGTSSPAAALAVAGSGYLTGGLEVGSPAGGMPGAGIINAQGLQINGASAGPFLNAGVASVTVVNPGTGYVPSTQPDVPDTITLSGSTYTTPAAIYVSSTKVVSATVANGGSGCTDGTQTVTGTSNGAGWGTGNDPGWPFPLSAPFQASVTVSGGTITAVNSITVPGVYYANPSNLAAEPVTGAGCSGATLSLTMGVLTAAVQNPGVYTAVTGSTATLTQGSDTGSGTGATFSATFGALSPSVLPENNTVFGYGAAPDDTGDHNVYIGFNAGHKETCGIENTFVGAEAGLAFTCSTGTFPEQGQNTFIGSFAGQADVSGLGNVFVGQKAGENNVSGGDNTFIGTHGGAGFYSGTNNVAVGEGILDPSNATTSGSGNTFLGFKIAVGAGQKNYNTIIGQYAGNALGAADNNTFLGAWAGQYQATGTRNTYLGEDSGFYATSTSDNTYIGYQAGMYATGGSYNIALGEDSFEHNTSGIYNIALGQDAFPSNTTGWSNIGIGYYALQHNTTGVGNIGIGGLGGNTTGGGNVAIGSFASGNTWSSASAQNTNATDTTVIGSAAAQGTASYHNQGTAVFGSQAGYNFTTGSDYNSLFGYSAGYNITSGANNIIIGANVNAPSATENQQLNIGNILYGSRIYNGSTVSSAPVSNGSIAIGTTTPYSRLTVWGKDTLGTTAAFQIASSASTTEFSVFDNGNATLAGSLTQNSDKRLKTNIQSLDTTDTLALVDKLNPVSFDWINGLYGSTTQLGFVAQQVQTVFPNLVSTTSPTKLTPGGTLGLNYTGLIAPIVEAIQEISSISGAFRSNLIAWLGDASNGVHDLYAGVIHSQEVQSQEADVQRLCIGTTCIDQTQLAALLASQGQKSAPVSSIATSSSTSAVSSSTPPVLKVNGANPATIEVGSSYSDLGATITGPAADLNLGIHVSVDKGATTTPDQITIDTSKPGTHTIEYFATDTSGRIGYATRTVTVTVTVTAASSTPSSSATVIATSTPSASSSDTATTTASTAAQ